VVVAQVLRMKGPVMCLAWNDRHGTLGLGQNPSMHFYSLSAPSVLAQRRARQRKMSITTSCEPPAALWLQSDKAKQSNAQKVDALAAKGTAGLAENEAKALQVRCSHLFFGDSWGPAEAPHKIETYDQGRARSIHAFRMDSGSGRWCTCTRAAGDADCRHRVCQWAYTTAWSCARRSLC
jgi:hypothetical protein